MTDASPTRLSATAPPFVPNPQAQQPYLGQTVAYYKLLEACGITNGVAPSNDCGQVAASEQSPARYQRRSLIRQKNRAYSNANAQLYQEMMFTQHQFHVPPVSVSRRASVVLPEGNYIGYYFKPETASIQQSATQPDEPTLTTELHISPSGAIDYCYLNTAPAAILPLLPLNGPIYRQAKLEDDYCPPLSRMTATPSNPINGLAVGFLPLLDAPKAGLGKYQQSDIKEHNLVAAHSNGETSEPRNEDPRVCGGHSKYPGDSIAKQRPVHYIYPAIPRQSML